jgi:microcystin-dependent protein
MPYVGEVRVTAFNFAPSGWALCNGQILAISQNTALFQIIGTTYGGNGVSTFALPDLQGRTPLGPGQGPGLSDRQPGDMGGSETHTLSASELPQHTHVLRGSSANGTTDRPDDNVPARNPAGVPQYAPAVAADANLAATAAASVGGGQPHTNMQPYIVVNYIIALQGVYPTP